MVQEVNAGLFKKALERGLDEERAQILQLVPTSFENILKGFARGNYSHLKLEERPMVPLKVLDRAVARYLVRRTRLRQLTARRAYKFNEDQALLRHMLVYEYARGQLLSNPVNWALSDRLAIHNALQMDRKSIIINVWPKEKIDEEMILLDKRSACCGQTPYRLTFRPEQIQQTMAILVEAKKGLLIVNITKEDIQRLQIELFSAFDRQDKRMIHYLYLIVSMIRHEGLVNGASQDELFFYDNGMHGIPRY